MPGDAEGAVHVHGQQAAHRVEGRLARPRQVRQQVRVAHPRAVRTIRSIWLLLLLLLLRACVCVCVCVCVCLCCVCVMLLDWL